MAEQVRVFVSHHHSPEEDAFTARLVADLEAAGADVWVDDLRISSNNFVQKISEGLEGRQWLVLVLTPQSVASPWVRNEVNAALSEYTAGRMLGVIPIVMTPTPESDIPMLWRSLHRYDAASAYEPARDGLLRALGLSLSISPAAPKSAMRSPQPAPTPTLPPESHAPSYPLPDVPERLALLGFHGINPSGTPAILPPLVSVAAGPFLMGSAESDKKARDNEKPQHRVEVAAFQIGRYPVTVAEYALAVKVGAVGEPQTYRRPKELNPNLGIREVTWQQQLRHFDHPVVCVSWQDATAYVTWLRLVTGETVWRLPSEAQWEKAARWDAQRGVSRIYPWGDTFSKGCCTTLDYRRLPTTTTAPVGSYPIPILYSRGRCASPSGAEDMAGNVWEWTSSLFKPYPYTESDGHEDLNSTENRTLRGGSWGNSDRDARAACRVSGRWDSLGINIGFRLALARRTGS